MEEHLGHHSKNWMWDMHCLDKFPHGGAVGNNYGIDHLPEGDCEKFGDSLHQLNKIVERISPDSSVCIPRIKSDLGRDFGRSKSMMINDNLSDSAYETFVGENSFDCSTEGNGFVERMDSVRDSRVPMMWQGNAAHDWEVETQRTNLKEIQKNQFARNDVKVGEFTTSLNNTFSEGLDKTKVRKIKLENSDKELPIIDQEPSGYNKESFDEKSKLDEKPVSSKLSNNNAQSDIEGHSDEAAITGAEAFENGSLDIKSSSSPEWLPSSKQFLEIGKYSGEVNPQAPSSHPGYTAEFSGDYRSDTRSRDTSIDQRLTDCDEPRMDESKLYSCLHCSYRAVKKGQLRKHMSVHGVFLCAHCEFSSEHAEELDAHRRANHPGLCGRKLCKKCRVLYQGDELDDHERSCSGEKQQWPCPVCSKEFKFLSVMKAHTRKWHPEAFEAESTWRTSAADSTTGELTSDGVDAESSRAPSTNEVVEPSFQTEKISEPKEVAPKPCKNKWANMTQDITPGSEMPFFCNAEGCSTVFRSDKELNIHRMKVHELGPKKYFCGHQDCNMQFLKYGHYKRHQNTHLAGERKFKCDWLNCGKAFCHTDNLKVHYRRHTDEKPYKCHRCIQSYRQKSGLKYHLEKAHDEKSIGRPGRKRKCLSTDEVPQPMEKWMNFKSAEERPSEGMFGPKGSLKSTGIMRLPSKEFENWKEQAVNHDENRIMRRMDGEPTVDERRTNEKLANVDDGKKMLKTKKSNEAEPSSSSDDCPGSLSEMGLNDEWVIDGSFNREVRSKDPDRSLNCMTPNTEPIDVDLREELRKLSDVINSDLSANDRNDPRVTQDDSSCEPNEAADQMFDISMNTSRDHVSYSQSHEISTRAGYQTSVDPMSSLDLQNEKRMQSGHEIYNRDFTPGLPISDQMYQMGNCSKGQGTMSYDADDQLDYCNSMHQQSELSELRKSSSESRIDFHEAMAFEGPDRPAWPVPPTESPVWSTRVVDNTSSISGRSAESSASGIKEELSEHYRQAHSALLPVSSPVGLRQTLNDVIDSSGYTGSHVAPSDLLPHCWPETESDRWSKPPENIFRGWCQQLSDAENRGHTPGSRPPEYTDESNYQYSNRKLHESAFTPNAGRVHDLGMQQYGSYETGYSSFPEDPARYRSMDEFPILSNHHRPDPAYDGMTNSTFIGSPGYDYVGRESHYSNPLMQSGRFYLQPNTASPGYLERGSSYLQNPIFPHQQPSSVYDGSYGPATPAVPVRPWQRMSGDGECFQALSEDSVISSNHVQSPYERSVLYNMTPHFF